MNQKIDAILTKKLSFLKSEEFNYIKDEINKLLSDEVSVVEKGLKEQKVKEDTLIHKLATEQKKNEDLRNQILSLTSDLHNEKNISKELKEKIILLNEELKGKFNNRESQTIAYQLGEFIIDGIKNPKEGIKKAPFNSLRLIKESIRRRAKKNNANKIDRILSIILELEKAQQVGQVNTIKNVSKNISLDKERSSSRNNETQALSNQIKLESTINNAKDVQSFARQHSGRVQYLCATSENLSNILARRTASNILIRNCESQSRTTKATVMLLESSYSFESNYWSYGLISNNWYYPATNKLLKVIDYLKDKGLKIILIDKSNVVSQDNLNLIRSKSDTVLFLSPTVMKAKNNIPNKVLLNNYFDERMFYPDNSLLKKGSTSFIADYENIHFSEIEGFNNYIDKIDKSKSFLVKQAELKADCLNDFDVTLTEDYSSLSDLSQLIKSLDTNIFISHSEQDYIPTILLYCMACGVHVITNEAKYITNELRECLTVVNSPLELSKKLNESKVSSWELKIKKHLSYRYAMQNYKSSEFSEMLYKISGGVKRKTSGIDLVTVIMATKREHFLQRILDNLSCQNYDGIEVIIMTQEWSEEGVNKLSKSLEEFENIKSFKVISDNSDITLGERLNICASYSSDESQIITKMDDDDFYFDKYIEDMLMPFSFGDFDMVGKCENFIYLEASDKLVITRESRGAYRNSKFVAGPTLFIRKNLFNKLGGFSHLNNGEDSDLIKRVLDEGSQIYSADPFNFIQFRSKEVTNHTWQVDHKVFEKSCMPVSKGLNTKYVNV